MLSVIAVNLTPAGIANWPLFVAAALLLVLEPLTLWFRSLEK